MALDADIAAAPDLLAVEKIKAQDYRNDLAARLPLAQQHTANDTKKTAEFEEFVAVQQSAAAGLLTPQQEVRLAIVRAIAANYMKPTTTSTQQSFIEYDANLDARKLEAAVLEIEKIGSVVPIVAKAAP